MCLPWLRRRSSSKEKSPSSHLTRTPSSELIPELTTEQKPSTQKGKGPLHAFTQTRARELFKTYRDEEVTDEEVIGSEGLEKFCKDAQLDMEGPKPLIVAWILGAKTLGRFTMEEWNNGTSTWQYVNLSQAYGHC